MGNISISASTITASKTKSVHDFLNYSCHHDGRGEGQNGEGSEGNRFFYSPWAGTARVGRWTAAGGDERSRSGGLFGDRRGGGGGEARRRRQEREVLVMGRRGLVGGEGRGGGVGGEEAATARGWTGTARGVGFGGGGFTADDVIG
jgi:hypothetical protein